MSNQSEEVTMFDAATSWGESIASNWINPYQKETGSNVSQKNVRILLIEDDEVDHLLIKTLLRKSRLARHELVWESNATQAYERMEMEDFDICLVDFHLRFKDALSILKTAKIRHYKLPFVVLTGLGTDEIDLEVMQHGAYDYLEKDGLTPALLERSIRYALREYHLREQLRYMAQFDELTGLRNRRALNQSLSEAIVRAKRQGTLLALMYLDLDGFKLVNDSFGHQAGDQILCEMADRMKSCVRESDIVGRLGGDEFAIVLENLHEAEDARRVAEAILSETMRPWTINFGKVNIGVSIGIALYPVHHTTGQGLLVKADQAMYEAKEAGKQTFRFAPL